MLLTIHRGFAAVNIVSIQHHLSSAKTALIAPIKTPARVTLISFVLSESITGILSLAVGGSLSIQAFVIAGICSTVLPYFVSIRMIEQQRTIQERNSQLQQLTSKLSMTNAELGERNAQLDTFSQTVAHDLQSPLSAVSGLSRLLEENYTRVAPETVREHLKMITYTTEKMSRIVEELLLLSRIEDAADLSLELLDMAAIVNEVSGYFELLLEDRKGTIVMPEEWPVAVGYEPWIEQVWINYVSNALKYGGRPPMVTLGATADGSVVRFWVQDNGPGLSDEQQKMLFMPFKRFHEIRAQGHGLGLSIVRNIVERLGAAARLATAAAFTSPFLVRRPHHKQLLCSHPFIELLKSQIVIEQETKLRCSSLEFAPIICA